MVGAGIVGLAHAYQGALRGLKVAVVDRDHRCVGASIRNFGFVTVTGQRSGPTWERAMRARNVWEQISGPAGISIEHRGLWMMAQRELAMHVLEEFKSTSMGEACELHSPSSVQQLAPWLRGQTATGALYSPHELRVESRDAIPKLAAWLAAAYGVTFFYGDEVLAVDPSTGDVATATRRFVGERIVLAPGTMLNGVASPYLRHPGLKLTRLQMLRVRPQTGYRMEAAAMSDLSLVRYNGYSDLRSSVPLLEQLRREEGESLEHGIHLIVVQSSDGTLVVGDSHHEDESPDPFAFERVDDLILRHMNDTLQLTSAHVVERWTGVYPTGIPDTDCLIEAPTERMRVVLVTSGTGASTAFGIAHEVFESW